MTVHLSEDTLKQILEADSYEEFKNLLKHSNCDRCELSGNRTHIVVDRGNAGAKIVFIGEAPGANEDQQGKAFIGRAGKILDQMLSEIGVNTDTDSLIINVVKCRPPRNRAPYSGEAEACSPFLKRQLELVSPKLIILLGASALKYMVQDKKEFEMHQEVGKFFNLPEYPGIDFFVIYHPAYLLYNPRKKDVFRSYLDVLKHHIDRKGLIPKGTRP